MKLLFRGPRRFFGPIHVNFRDWLFYRAWIASGKYEEGGVVPRWLYPLWFLAEPMRFVRSWLGCDHRVPNRDRWRFEGVELSGIFFSAMKGSTVPGPWMRIVRRDDGLVTWEEQSTRRPNPTIEKQAAWPVREYAEAYTRAENAVNRKAKSLGVDTSKTEKDAP